jgi:hypothetical protein
MALFSPREAFLTSLDEVEVIEVMTIGPSERVHLSLH